MKIDEFNFYNKKIFNDKKYPIHRSPLNCEICIKKGVIYQLEKIIDDFNTFNILVCNTCIKKIDTTNFITHEIT